MSLPAPRLTARRVHLLTAYAASIPLLLTASTGLAYRLLRTSGYEKTNVRWLMELHSMSIVGMGWIYPLLLFLIVATSIVTGFTMTILWSSLFCCCARSKPKQLYQSVNTATGASTTIDPSGLGLSEPETEDEDDENGSSAATLDSSFLDRRVPNPSPWTLSQRVRSVFPERFTWRWMHRVAGTGVLVPLGVTATTGAMYTVAREWLFWEKDQYKQLMALHEGRWLEKSGTMYVFLLGTSTLALTLTGLYMLYQRTACLHPSPSTPRYSTLPSSSHSISSSSSSSASANSRNFAEPSQNTMARISKAFDINAADETEDEMGIGSPAHE